MSKISINLLEKLSESEKNFFLKEKNHLLKNFSVCNRIEWALEYLPKNFILSSSFGVQSLVLLHIVIEIFPKIPIVFIDTGYLFPETYKFVDEITKKLNLNLKIFSSIISPAWQEARYGKLWQQGIAGIEKYNYLTKVEPMHRALHDLNCATWFAGLRRVQAKNRKMLSILSIQKKIFKFLPIVDWDNQQIFAYLKKHKLKNHPLADQGYVSLGDTHTTQKLTPGMTEEETRFFGLKRECGLHEK